MLSICVMITVTCHVTLPACGSEEALFIIIIHLCICNMQWQRQRQARYEHGGKWCQLYGDDTHANARNADTRTISRSPCQRQRSLLFACRRRHQIGLHQTDPPLCISRTYVPENGKCHVCARHPHCSLLHDRHCCTLCAQNNKTKKERQNRTKWKTTRLRHRVRHRQHK